MNYKEILQNILKNGKPKQPTRLDTNGNPIPVENRTIGVFGSIFEHDMSQSFPLTTLRKMPFKSTCIELQGFIAGTTSKNWYKEKGCNYWNFWANPQAVQKHKLIKEFDFDQALPMEELKAEYNARLKIAQEETDDLGPCIYGANWRNFHDPETVVDKYDNHGTGYPVGTPLGQSIDQLKSLVDKLKTCPYDRRMVVTSWNPLGLNHTALPACHTQFTVCVYGDKLNLAWDQRSCDWLINQTICTYGLLLLLLCEESGLKPGFLQGRFVDNHIYENQIDAAKLIVSRNEKELPQVKIKRKPDGSFSIFDWTYDEVELIDYNPHPPIDIGKVTV